MPVIHNMEEGSAVSKRLNFSKMGGQFGESRQVHELSTVNSKKLFHTFQSALSPKEYLFPTELFFLCLRCSHVVITCNEVFLVHPCTSFHFSILYLYYLLFLPCF